MRLFESLIGGEPDAYQKISPPQSQLPVTVQLVVKDGVQHRLQCHLGRIDYFIEPVAASDSFPLLENPERYIDAALARVAGFSSAVGSITRGAVVLTLAESSDDWSLVREVFAKLFSEQINFEDDRDLQFQTSRRLETSDGVTCNQLLRWYAENFTFHQFVGGQSTSSILATSETYLINYMIDVNSAPEFHTVFNAEDHDGLFRKLAEVAKGFITLKRLEDWK